MNHIFLLFVIAVFVAFYLTTLRSVSYYVEESNLFPDWPTTVDLIIKSEPSLSQFNLYRVTNPDSAVIKAYLVPRDKMPISKEKYPDGTSIHFSYTWPGNAPIIKFDATNWILGVPQSGLSLQNYRTYVIVHEFLHALGYDHQVCDETTAVNGVCPVMYQSTRGPPKGFTSGYKVTPSDFANRI
jgi:hypothetical protein